MVSEEILTDKEWEYFDPLIKKLVEECYYCSGALRARHKGTFPKQRATLREINEMLNAYRERLAEDKAMTKLMIKTLDKQEDKWKCNFCGYEDEFYHFEVQDKETIAMSGSVYYCQGCNRDLDFDDMVKLSGG